MITLKDYLALSIPFLVMALGAVLGFFYGFVRTESIKREIERPSDRTSKELGDREAGKQLIIRGGQAGLSNLVNAFFYGMRERNVPYVRLVIGRFADEEMHTDHSAIFVDTIIGNTLVTFPILVSLYDGSQDIHYSWLRFTKRRLNGRILPRDWKILLFFLMWPTLVFFYTFEVGCRIFCNLDSEVRESWSTKKYSEEAIQATLVNLGTLVNIVFMEAIDRVGISSDAVQEIVPPPVVYKPPIKLYP